MAARMRGVAAVAAVVAAAVTVGTLTASGDSAVAAADPPVASSGPTRSTSSGPGPVTAAPVDPAVADRLAPGRASATAQRLCAADPSRFGPAPDDTARAAAIMAGQLQIASFPSVALPADPRWDERLVPQANWETKYLSLEWTDVLRRQYLATGERALLRRYAFLLNDFVTDNPDQARARSRWTFYDHPTGLRSVVLSCATTVLGTPRWLTRAMRKTAAITSRPEEYKGRGNHALMQNSGLLSIGCTLDEPALRALAVRRTRVLLLQSIDAQGVTDEGSFAYHWANYRWWTEMRDKLAACRLPAATDADFARIDRMPAFAAHATQPTGRGTPFGDTHVGVTGPATGRRPSATTSVWSRGYLFTRSGWGTTRPASEESFASLRFGQSAAEQAHGHEDAGNLEFFAYGTPLVTDSGMYAYYGGPWRYWVRTPQAHNVVTAEGAAYRVDERSPLTFRKVNRHFTAASMTTRVIDGATWKRSILYSRTGHYVLVDDQVTQATPRRLTQGWNLPVAEHTVTSGPRPRVDQAGPGPGLSVVWLAGAPQVSLHSGEAPETRQALGWRSHRYGEITPAPVARAQSAPTTTWHTVTLLAARPAGAAPGSVRVGDVSVTSTGVAATIRTPSGVERVGLRPTGAFLRKVS